jgi:hypothetical protein
MQGLVVIHLRDRAGKADVPALQHEDAGCDLKKADILFGDKECKAAAAQCRQDAKCTSIIPDAQGGIGGMQASPAWTVDAK